MPYVKNPYGRISEVEEDDMQKWVNEGFTIPTPEEIEKSNLERKEKIQEMKLQAQLYEEQKNSDGIYLITVTQGGKDGYGIASKAMLEELKKLGVKISIENRGQKVALLFHAPYSIMRLEAPVKILFTMFESTRIPDEWLDYLEVADKIIVPSKWNQKVFEKSGIKTDVIPLGYNDDVFKYVERQPKRPQRKDFVFLHYNAFNIRKGFTEVFKAFVKEFAPTEPVKMIFKTTLERPPLPLPPSQYPNIEVRTGSISDKELFELCGESDCFVFPSRGEGFGMTPVEAMATGLPTIVPNAHGISEYFNSDYMYEAKVAEECPALYSRYKGMDVGNMVVCDVDQLAAQMRWIYEHEEEALAKGKAASEYVKQWTFKKTAVKLKETIDELTKQQVNEKPVKNILPLSEVE